jgi:hypothetical protein
VEVIIKKHRRICRSHASPPLLPSDCGPRRRSCSAQEEGSARASVGEIGRRGAVEQGRHDPGRHEGERDQRTCRFDLAFAAGDRREAGGAAVGQIVDPSRLGDRDSSASLREGFIGVL